MIGDASLRKVVGADALRAVARADQRLSRRGGLRVLVAHLLVADPGREHAERLLPVLVLGARVLALDHDPRGQMRDADRGFGLVDVLPACARGAESVDPQLGGIQHHLVDRVGLGQDRDGARRGVDAPLCLGLGHALYAMPARLELELRVHALPDDPGDDLLVAAQLGGTFRDDLDLPGRALCIAGVHAEEIAREQRRLVAPGAGAYLEEGIALVVGVLGKQRLLQLGFEPLHRGPGLLQFLVGVGLHRRIIAHIPGIVGVTLGLAVAFIQGSNAGELGVLARELPELIHVPGRVLRREETVQLFQAPDVTVELGTQSGLHFERNRRASAAARSRPSSPALPLSAWVGPCMSLLVRPLDSASRTPAGSSPRASSLSACCTSSRRAASAFSRSARMSGTFSRTCIQRMNRLTCMSMIASACSTAERRESRFADTIPARSSTVYRKTSSSSATSGSISRGTARSTMNIGRRRLARSARSTRPLPRIGSEEAVQDTTMSCSGSCPGRALSSSARPLKRCARRLARSSVRLATVMRAGPCAAKCVAHSSIISPAPMSRTFCSRRLGKMRAASFTAAAAIETLAVPTCVVERTSLATANERWKRRCSTVPSVPADSAARAASFIWPRICGSPSTIESSPDATRNA